MDLLQSLNLEDLPEQHTRTSQLTNIHPDFQLFLGFDACLACGKTSPKLTCLNCNRVKYCSEKCRKCDSLPVEGEEALGHSALICALLCTCSDDDLVEVGDGKVLVDEKRIAALDRIISEFESYPATLSNVLLEGPIYEKTLNNHYGGDLVIHVIGAGVDSELWEGHPKNLREKEVFECYAEALAELADKNKLKAIHLTFVGPDCPKKNIKETVPIPHTRKGKFNSELNVMTKKERYNEFLFEGEDLKQPDIVVFFNPGFTCPDYNWKEALASIKIGTPYLITTNTELEGIADIQFLVDNSFISDLPPGLANMLNMKSNDDHDGTSFFSVNPFCGDRVRQSGTMANDLYVKNRWIYGGKFGKSLGKDIMVSNKKRKIEGAGNTKSSNPALV